MTNLLTQISEIASKQVIKLDFYDEQIEEIRKAISLPENEDLFEWILFNLIEFTDQLKILNGFIACTCETPKCAQFLLDNQIDMFFEAISDLLEKIQQTKRQRAQQTALCCKLMLRVYDHFFTSHQTVCEREIYLSFKMFYVFVKEFNLMDMDDESIEE